MIIWRAQSFLGWIVAQTLNRAADCDNALPQWLECARARAHTHKHKHIHTFIECKKIFTAVLQVNSIKTRHRLNATVEKAQHWAYTTCIGPVSAFIPINPVQL